MAGRGRVSIETPEQRFNKKYVINELTDCWEWQHATNNIGYGMFRWASGKMRTAHRASYEIHKGPIPTGLSVCHTCDNPKCVNPEHLWAGTLKDNAQDMVAKGRCGMGMLGRKHALGTCEHCGIVKPVNTLAKHHNDKCKHKP
jgi:HNH endonuclease